MELFERLRSFAGSQELDVMLGVLVAMAFGGLIGLERELKSRPAGFRTHMLVAGAAALLVGVVELWVDAVLASVQEAGDGAESDALTAIIKLDPLRVVEAVVAGVAFIGAGCVFAGRNGENVQGITTAASLLMAAVIGLAVGLGFGLLALAVTVTTLLVLTSLRKLEATALKRISNPRASQSAEDGRDG
jgi:putative Mg2+ transporter-C (MgtC) family protein